MLDLKNTSNEDLLVPNLINKDLIHSIFKIPIIGKNKDCNLVIFGMGCFWGVEKLFWGINGVRMTAVGYSGGMTKSPDYKEVCSGETNHNEVVLIHYKPKIISFSNLLTLFWESHDPTQGMRQGNDIGSQYRSGIYTFSSDDLVLAKKTRYLYEEKLRQNNFGTITTEITFASKFYYAEEYHQQYLVKNPNGYCALRGTGIKM